jgi:hypothetical protein
MQIQKPLRKTIHFSLIWVMLSAMFVQVTAQYLPRPPQPKPTIQPQSDRSKKSDRRNNLQDGTFRTVRVEINSNNKRKLIARTRQGYYARNEEGGIRDKGKIR